MLEERIQGIIEGSIDSMGYDIVQVKFMDSGHHTLQIMIERKDLEPITLEDCTSVSRQVSALLDVEDPIKDEYNLEVSSPGLDRPLTKLVDYERFAGERAKIILAELLEGRKRFKGILQGIKDELVVIELDDVKEEDSLVGIPFALIASAHLIPDAEALFQQANNNKNTDTLVE